ncbi:MAG: alpha/beta fold hydrolase, partial [Chloroflexota bacterium]
MPNAPIILVPGLWLGAWAWDEVAAILRADGHDVTPLTPPGMASAAADRSSVTFADHVDAIVEAVRAASSPPVLVLHSFAGFTGYAATDVVPDRVAHVVYVDTAPGKPPLEPDFTDAEKPLDWDSVAKEENLDGLTDEQLATFRERALPAPGALLRGEFAFTNDARRDIPSTI